MSGKNESADLRGQGSNNAIYEGTNPKDGKASSPSKQCTSGLGGRPPPPLSDSLIHTLPSVLQPIYLSIIKVPTSPQSTEEDPGVLPSMFSVKNQAKRLLRNVHVASCRGFQSTVSKFIPYQFGRIDNDSGGR